MSFNRPRRLALGALVLGATAASTGFAQDAPYPNRPVRVIVPFAAGGTADLVARIVAEQLTVRMKQPFVVDNRPGAGGTIGADALAKSPPDGYTLGWGSVSSHATSVSLYPKLPYDPRRDFTPIVLAAAIPNVMVVTPALPARTLDEFIALAKRSPGQLNYGSIGNATSQHLGGELFKMRTGTQMVHVPYRNNGALTGDLISGTLHVVFDNLPNVIGQIQSGKLRAIGVTTSQRWPALPDVPTLSELGLRDFDISSWLGLFAPAGLPGPVATQLNEQLNAIMAMPDVQQKLVTAGAQPLSGSPQQLAEHVDREIRRWAEVVKTSNARID